MAGNDVADKLADFIQEKIKPIVEKNGVSFISSVGGNVQLGAKDREELKKEIGVLLRGLLNSGFVTKVEIAELLTKAETSWWENN